MATAIPARVITAHEATLKTATVEVKALTISGRQVTLSVFRQLKEEPLVNVETAELCGVPWGVVNYHPDKCAETYGDVEHIHVVWQKGTELRRSAVYRRSTSASGYRTHVSDLEREFAAYVVALAIAGRELTGDFWERGVGREKGWLKWRVRGVEVFADVPDALYHLVHFNAPLPSDYWRLPSDEQPAALQRHRWHHRELLIGELREWMGEHSFDVAHWDREVGAAYQRLQDFQAAWEAQYAALSALDHLFIAV